MYKRIHIIVMDSVGVGELPDAALFEDSGCNTLGHISETSGLNIPNLENMGIGVLNPLKTVNATVPQKGYITKLAEVSNGKDTMTGHWELMGLLTKKPFPVYPNGFPAELIKEIEKFSGRKVLCNLPYSGTKVIDDYGINQLETGALIVYTSADPVLQIAAHEEIIPLEELYSICKYVRSITAAPPWLLGRIIARPFIGKPGKFLRTANRHDYAVSPHGKTALDYLNDGGFDVIAIGKIGDIFNMQGITSSIPTKSNMDGIDKLLSVMKQDFNGISFLNLVDFDAMYGHRRDPGGYAKALEEFDRRLPEVQSLLHPDDLLMITADHGNDPTFKGTDHTREYVPLILYSPSMTDGGILPTGCFSDVAATVCDNFGISGTDEGRSLFKT